MNDEYEVWICTPEGRRLALLDGLYAFTASRIVGGIGRFNGVTAATFDPAYVRLDGVIQVNYRGRLWRTYFLRRWRWEEQDGEWVFKMMSCPCCNELMLRRSVIAYAGSAQAEQTDYADDMMKQVVTDSQSDVTLPTPDAGTRAWSKLSVETQWGLGPALTLGFSGKQLLTDSGGGVLTQIANAAKKAGTQIFWEVVPVPSANTIDYVFRTYLDQPGADVRHLFTFSEQDGSLAETYYEEDWTGEVNYAYGAGKGQGAARNVVQAYDADRYGASIWARREGVYDAPSTSDAALPDATDAYLKAHDGIIRAGGRPVDTDEVQFGRDWWIGDLVKVRVEKGAGSGEYAAFDAMVTTGAIGIRESGEAVWEFRFSYES